MKTPITDTLREFFASRYGNVTPEPRNVTAAKLILARIRVMELETLKKLNETEEFLQQRRAAGRARSRRLRERRRNVTQQKSPLCDSFLSDSQLKKGLSIKKESSSLRVTAKSKNKNGSALDPAWQPNEKHRMLATSLGHDERFLARCADDMRDWAKANANRAIARKADWDATFSGWLRREAARRPKPRRPSGPSLTDIASGMFHFGEQR